MRYAIVESEKVTNVILWDGNKDLWHPGTGVLAVLIADTSLVAAGFAYVAGVFTDPTPSSATPLVPSKAMLVSAALVETRILRQPIMNILDGMQASALSKNDAATATTIEVAKQALKDLTSIDLSAANTADAIKAIILNKYKVIAAGLPASVLTAFAAVLS